MAQRLKVFVTSDGLTDYVVAASSRAKALAAWGAHQDLFKTGGAHETDDPDLVAAATATPGEVLRRAADTKAALAKAPKPPKRTEPSKAATQKVAKLERELTDEAARHEAELAEIQAAQLELETRKAAVQEGFAARRAKLQAALREARAALR
ncbi:MAG: hypothetical protein Q7T84_16055 [Phenylobacterium sp.]|uniref:hypothetical protein n=1 Tax=Phenylobacterium sp. TaxID=1871053 RepID=UPI00271B0933|nr:hypothetical protein [Phenylobacterium sp.]MDO9432817.1 hypothetical protein [Phenylobacterium sp.]